MHGEVVCEETSQEGKSLTMTHAFAGRWSGHGEHTGRGQAAQAGDAAGEQVSEISRRKARWRSGHVCKLRATAVGAAAIEVGVLEHLFSKGLPDFFDGALGNAALGSWGQCGTWYSRRCSSSWPRRRTRGRTQAGREIARLENDGELRKLDLPRQQKGRWTLFARVVEIN